MKLIFEWQIPENEGLISLVIRMDNAEAARLVATDLLDPSQPDPVDSQATQRLVVEQLQNALANGSLVLPQAI